MNRSGIKIHLVSVVCLFLMVKAFTVSAYESGYQIESVELMTYRDGVVHVNSLIAVNETFPSTSFELLTSSLDNVLVMDENFTVLDYVMEANNMTIFSFGASRVRVEYDTIALTEKESGVWTLNLQNPYDVSVYLPLESTIVYLNNIPLSLNTENGIITLSLYPSKWEISYILPIVGSALFKVSDLTAIPAEVETGDEVVISVVVENFGDVEGSYTIVLSINGEEEDAKTVILESGASTKVEFKVKKDTGTYDIEIDNLTTHFKVNVAPSISNYFLHAIILIIIVIVVSLLIMRRRRTSRSEGIFEEHPHLRREDREVIKFLEKSGGKAFETEIRDNFPEIPKTSLWRLIKRLEKMEVVSVKRIGLQNQVILKR